MHIYHISMLQYIAKFANNNHALSQDNAYTYIYITTTVYRVENLPERLGVTNGSGRVW